MKQRDMKTVILLDRSTRFAEHAKETFDAVIREGPKTKKLNIRKTFWTWCLEGVFEMQRILSDVYPKGSLQIRIALSDYMGKMLDQGWTDKLFTRNELAKIIASVNKPCDDYADFTPTSGLKMALEALAIESPIQKEHNYDARYILNGRTNHNSEAVRIGGELKSDPSFPTVENNGNLIVYTRFKMIEEIEELKQKIADFVASINQIANAPSSPVFCPITSLRVFIVNYYNAGEECPIKTHPLEEHPTLPIIKFWVISRKASDMCEAIHSVLVHAFDLASTTVTKIPMKEDNRGSINYDVELFHEGRSHELLRETNFIARESKNATSNKGVTYDTMRLTWTTAPKLKWTLFPHHGAGVPCTTAVSYSRPSACLTQFVRDGRCVLLDSERSKDMGENLPEKLISHVLVANRGRMFILDIDFMQKRYNKARLLKKYKPAKPFRASQPPVNVHQLRHMYKQMELKMIGKNYQDGVTTKRLARKRKAVLNNVNIEERFNRISKNIPMFQEDTFVFYNDETREKMEPLVTTMTQKKLSDSDVEQCNANIIKLVQARANQELLVPENTNIGSCLVKNISDPDEQMRVVLVEMAKHLVKYSKFSIRHEGIYLTFMATLGVSKMLAIDAKDGTAIDKMFVKTPFFERATNNAAEATDAQTDSSDFSISDEEEDGEYKEKDQKMNPHSKHLFKTFVKNYIYPNYVPTLLCEAKDPSLDIPKIKMAKSVDLNVYANVCEKLEMKEAKIRREFVGRELHGNKAPLYQQLAEKLDGPASPAAAGDRSDRPERTERMVDRSDRSEMSRERIERAERTERLRNLERGGSGTPPPPRRTFN